MAPALTKVLKNGHGIHLSSPPVSVRADSNRRAMRIIQPERHATLMEDGELQAIWLNLSPFHSMDSRSPSSLLDASVNPAFSPCRKASAVQSETDSLPSSSSFVERFSCNKGQRDFQASCSAVPGVPGMFLAPEHKSQEACVQREQSAAPECRPDGGDVHYSSLTFNGVCPSYSHEGINSQGCGALFATPATLTQGKQVTGAGCPPSASLQSCVGRASPDQLASKAGLQDALKERLSRQLGLHDRAGKLQRRLQCLLGEQAVRHCSQQLEGLKRSSEHGKGFHARPAPTGPDALPPKAGTIPRFRDQPSENLGFVTQVSEFNQRSQLVLSGLQAALDSEATASSSGSDEEPEENHGRTPSMIGRSCEMQWLEERAELGSKWSLLQLHLDILEERIQHLNRVHKDKCSDKPRVLLANSQPLTDQQIQRTLMKEITGLSCTGSDTEVCSPARLLHNIERQSAHLNQFVNSLMPPLSFSPVSKQPTSWNDKRTFTSGQREAVLFPESSKRRLTNRKLFKGDASCVCARTRPLISYRKPKLYTLYPHNSSSTLNSVDSTSTLSSRLVSSSCSFCARDPVDLCLDLNCSTSSTIRSTETSMFDCPRRFRGTGAPFLLNVKSSCLTKRQKYKHHARQHRKALLGLSPIRVSGSRRTRTQPSRTSQKIRKRKHIRGVLEEEEDVQQQLYDAEENSDDMLKSSYTCVSHKQASQGFVRRHQRENTYSINSVVMPMSLTKVEKLQYKDILTPRWRLVETHPPLEMDAVIKAHSEEVQVEDLGDEVFARRHLALEQKEKLRWSSWEKRKCSTRAGSRPSGSVGGTYTSGEESSLECSAQLDTDEQSKSEEQLPHTPWELRVFPLDEDAEVAHLSTGLQHANARDLRWTTTESSGDLSTSDNSDLHPDQSSGATLPSRGRCRNRTPNGSFPCRSPHI